MSSGRFEPFVVGDYRVLDPIGQGAMATVYRAREANSDRLVAIKIGNTLDSERLGRFEREGEITAALNHPNIVRVHAAGVVDRRPYLVYQLAEGAQTLEQVLHAWPLRRRVEALRDVARALGFAHARGVVHRDVKPENVLVTRDGTVLLADFGLASAASLDPMTRTGVMLGTPLYLAPEVVRDGSSATSPQTDVYSLGVMLYEALAGEHPYAHQGFGAVMDPKLRRIRPPGKGRDDVPAQLSRVCMQAVADAQSRRFADGDELADALDAWLNGAPAGRRVGLALVAVVAVAVGLIGVGIRGLSAASTKPRETVEAPTPVALPPQAAKTGAAEAPPAVVRSAAQEAKLQAAIRYFTDGSLEDPSSLMLLEALKGAFGPRDQAGGQLADLVLRLVRSSRWRTEGIPALKRLVATGARPSKEQRGAAERLCETTWAVRATNRISEAEVEVVFVCLAKLDVDLDGLHNSYMREVPKVTDRTPPALSYVRTRAHLSDKRRPDSAPAYGRLLQLGRDLRLGPTTRARALSLGLRSVTEPARRVALIEEAARLDPHSAHVPLARAHTLLSVKQTAEGLRLLRPAWLGWRRQHRERAGSAPEEAKLLDRSLRMLLQNGLAKDAEALLEESRGDGSYLPGHEVMRDRVRRFRRKAGPTHGDRAWLRTGVGSPKR